MKTNFILCLLAGIVLSSVNCSLDDIKREDSVLVLKKANFDEAVSSDTVILVEFCKRAL